MSQRWGNRWHGSCTHAVERRVKMLAESSNRTWEIEHVGKVAAERYNSGKQGRARTQNTQLKATRLSRAARGAGRWICDRHPWQPIGLSATALQCALRSLIARRSQTRGAGPTRPLTGRSCCRHPQRACRRPCQCRPERPAGTRVEQKGLMILGHVVRKGARDRRSSPRLQQGRSPRG